MPDNHWNGYTKFIKGALDSAGMEDYWKEVGPAFSEDFSNWMDNLYSENKTKK